MQHLKLFEEFITTLDNGGTPLVISHDEKNKIARIYDLSHDYGFKKVFPGHKGKKGDKNSAVLYDLGNQRYLFAGSEIYEFDAPEEITEFYAPIGNSGVPYPVAMSDSKVYFMLDKVMSDKKNFKKLSDPAEIYGEFYELGKGIQKKRFAGVKKVEGRIFDKFLSK